MKESSYNELNEYLNDVCLKLFKSKDIENTFESITKINNHFNNTYNKKYLNIEEETNNLSFEDVLKIAREIIASIDIKYLSIFNQILINGQLDFDYDNETPGSYFSFRPYNIKINSNVTNYKNEKIINIKRNFNYDDVVVLIHEFMHYLNSSKRNDIIGNVIDEFISIYFELYANEFICKVYNPKQEELQYFDRLNFIFDITGFNKIFENLIIMYKNFGNLDSNSYQNFNEFITDIYNSDSYNREVTIALRKFNNSPAISDLIIIGYNYLYSTIIAFNARQTSNYRDILRLSENINSSFNKNKDIQSLLSEYNIKLNSNLENTAVNGIKEYLNSFKYSLKKGK